MYFTLGSRVPLAILLSFLKALAAVVDQPQKDIVASKLFLDRRQWLSQRPVPVWEVRFRRSRGTFQQVEATDM